jgi:hypothetical protein
MTTTTTYVRVYADERGESHFEDVEVALTPRNYAPPAPALSLSPVLPATGFAFVRIPAGWHGDWHPTPLRQVFVYLAGEVEGETSDGERRRFGPGSVTLAEDTTGKGHRSWVVGDADALLVVAQLPE